MKVHVSYKGSGVSRKDSRPLKAAAWAEWLDELRRHSPEWAAQLAAARTRQELKHVVSHLAMRLVAQMTASDQARATSRDQIRTFMVANLHRGLTLKDLSAFWGYSEKYSSELFLNVMGEPFSQSLKQLRVQKAKRLLAHSPAPIADIAEALGFSDQFAFSHFFKKAVGCSPRQFRNRSGKPTRAQRSAALSPSGHEQATSRREAR